MTTVDPIPERQLLSYSVRGAEVAAVYQFLAQFGPQPAQRISDCFARTEPSGQTRRDDLLYEVLDFLRALELVLRYPGKDSVKLYRLADDTELTQPFELVLLGRLHTMTDGRDAFRAVHQAIVAADLFFVTKEDLLKRLESSISASYAWNIEKLRTWEHLATYSGLVRSTKPALLGDLMCCPTPSLLLATLTAYQAGTDQSQPKPAQQRLPASDWLDFAEARHFVCRTERQRVHSGLAASLLSMEKAGLLRLSMGSDAPSTIVLKTPRVSRNVSHIQVL